MKLQLLVLFLLPLLLIPAVAGQTEQSELDKLKIKYQTLLDNYNRIDSVLIMRSLAVNDLKERELQYIEQSSMLWERIGDNKKEISQLEKKLTVIPELNQHIRDLKTMIEERDDKILLLKSQLNNTGMILVHIDEAKRIQEIVKDKIQNQIFEYPEYVNISDDYFFMKWHLTTNTLQPIFSFNMIWEQHLKANFPEQPDTIVVVTIKDPNGNIVQTHLYPISGNVDSFYDVMEHDNFVEPGLYTITLNYNQPNGKLKGELVGTIYYVHHEILTNAEKIYHLEKQLKHVKNHKQS